MRMPDLRLLARIVASALLRTGRLSCLWTDRRMKARTSCMICCRLADRDCKRLPVTERAGPVAIVVTGPPATGKSSLGAALAEELNAALVGRRRHPGVDRRDSRTCRR